MSVAPKQHSQLLPLPEWERPKKYKTATLSAPNGTGRVSTNVFGGLPVSMGKVPKVPRVVDPEVLRRLEKKRERILGRKLAELEASCPVILFPGDLASQKALKLSQVLVAKIQAYNKSLENTYGVLTKAQRGRLKITPDDRALRVHDAKMALRGGPTLTSVPGMSMGRAFACVVAAVVTFADSADGAPVGPRSVSDPRRSVASDNLYTDLGNFAADLRGLLDQLTQISDILDSGQQSLKGRITNMTQWSQSVNNVRERIDVLSPGSIGVVSNVVNQLDGLQPIRVDGSDYTDIGILTAVAQDFAGLLARGGAFYHAGISQLGTFLDTISATGISSFGVFSNQIDAQVSNVDLTIPSTNYTAVSREIATNLVVIDANLNSACGSALGPLSDTAPCVPAATVTPTEAMTTVSPWTTRRISSSATSHPATSEPFTTVPPPPTKPTVRTTAASTQTPSEPITTPPSPPSTSRSAWGPSTPPTAGTTRTRTVVPTDEPITTPPGEDSTTRIDLDPGLPASAKLAPDSWPMIVTYGAAALVAFGALAVGGVVYGVRKTEGLIRRVEKAVNDGDVEKAIKLTLFEGLRLRRPMAKGVETFSPGEETRMATLFREKIFPELTPASEGYHARVIYVLVNAIISAYQNQLVGNVWRFQESGSHEVHAPSRSGSLQTLAGNFQAYFSQPEGPINGFSHIRDHLKLDNLLYVMYEKMSLNTHEGLREAVKKFLFDPWGIQIKVQDVSLASQSWRRASTDQRFYLRDPYVPRLNEITLEGQVSEFIQTLFTGIRSEEINASDLYQAMSVVLRSQYSPHPDHVNMGIISDRVVAAYRGIHAERVREDRRLLASVSTCLWNLGDGIVLVQHRRVSPDADGVFSRPNVMVQPASVSVPTVAFVHSQIVPPPPSERDDEYFGFPDGGGASAVGAADVDLVILEEPPIMFGDGSKSPSNASTRSGHSLGSDARPSTPSPTPSLVSPTVGNLFHSPGRGPSDGADVLSGADSDSHRLQSPGDEGPALYDGSDLLAPSMTPGELAAFLQSLREKRLEEEANRLRSLPLLRNTTPVASGPVSPVPGPEKLDSGVGPEEKQASGYTPSKSKSEPLPELEPPESLEDQIRRVRGGFTHVRRRGSSAPIGSSAGLVVSDGDVMLHSLDEGVISAGKRILQERAAHQDDVLDSVHHGIYDIPGMPHAYLAEPVAHHGTVEDFMHSSVPVADQTHLMHRLWETMGSSSSKEVDFANEIREYLMPKGVTQIQGTPLESLVTRIRGRQGVCIYNQFSGDAKEMATIQGGGDLVAYAMVTVRPLAGVWRHAVEYTTIRGDDGHLREMTTAEKDLVLQVAALRIEDKEEKARFLARMAAKRGDRSLLALAPTVFLSTPTVRPGGDFLRRTSDLMLEHQQELANRDADRARLGRAALDVLAEETVEETVM